MTDPLVAALLPVRLETRFLPPGHPADAPAEPREDAPDTWRLRLRIVPDTISVDRHDPVVTPAERHGLAALWRSLSTEPEPADPAGSAARAVADPTWPDAFARLAAQAGPGRAAWLVRSVPVRRVDGRVEVEAAAGAGREGWGVVRAFPGAVEVWVRWARPGGSPEQPPEVLHTLHPDRSVLEAVPGSGPSAVPPAWLVDWEAGVEAGMAAEIPLPASPETIEVLGVSGIREVDPDVPDDSLAALFRAHAEAGDLTLAGAGEATSVVRGAAVVGTGRGTREWLDEPGPLAPLPARTLAALLGAADAELAGARATTSADDAIDADLVRVTFPALWGYALGGVLRVVEPVEIPRLWRWARTWLRPQGSFATVVVHDTAYGVLPVVDPARVAGAAGPALGPVADLLGPLGEAVRRWAEAADAEPGASGGGVREVVDVLRRGPVPGGFGHATYVPADLRALLVGEPLDAARQEWDEAHAAAVRVLHGVRGRRYWAYGPRVAELDLPLVVGATPEPEAAAEEIRVLLEEWRERWLTEIELGGEVVRALYGAPEQADSGIYLERAHPRSLLARLLVRSLALAGVSLDLLRQRLGLPGPGDEPPHELVESLVVHAGATRARHHLAAVAQVVAEVGSGWAEEDGVLVEELTWLAREGFDLVAHLPWSCVEDAAWSRRVHRALRALLETAAGRWDAWWEAVGAAHLRDVHDAGAGHAVAGVYGWVDRPFRGTPSPGPGGLLMAPSLPQAVTAAALRDRAVHDGDRWALRRTSATIGPARAALADIAAGWHPAEALGRIIERRVVEVAARDGVTLRTHDLAPLRDRFPLRVGQLHGGSEAFGCSHGLDVLATPAAELPALPQAPGALEEAVDAVREIWATAADLVLAESVHGVLAGRPERAAVATEALAGQGAVGTLDVLQAARTGRAVRTLVLAALPVVAPPAGAAGVLAAAPGLDAAIRAAAPASGWSVTLPGDGGAPVVVSLADLGLAPVHAAVLDDAALTALAVLHAEANGRPVTLPDAEPGSPGAVAVPGADTARRLLAAFAGRAPDPAELAPPAAGTPDGEDPPGVVAAREAATEVWRQRATALAAAATDLAQAVQTDVDAAAEAWAAERERARALAAGDPPEPARPGPDRASLAEDVLALAAWGLGPDAEVRDLFSAEPERGEQALAATLAHLARGATTLRARVAAHTPGTGGAAALAELVAGRPLPIGTPAPTALLGESLEEAGGTAVVDDWLPAVAQVRPALGTLVAMVGSPGVTIAATQPADPWRLAALTPLPADAAPRPEPRLAVVVGPEATLGGDREWVVVDAFTEHVPDPEPYLGAAFDAATPSAAPPQAVLLVPTVDPALPVTAADLPEAVLLARSMAHARMASTATLAQHGLGPLAAASMLPQDGDTGCPLGDDSSLPRYDRPAALVPLPSHEDTADVVAAVTADAGWMVGAQWRLGEHAGEDAASPVLVETTLEQEDLGEPLLAEQPAESVVEAGGGAWRPDDLHYAAAWPAGGSGVVVDRHDAGDLDWWATRRPGGPAPDVATAARTDRMRPARVRWPGQPRRRYWQVDDVAAEPVGRGPDTAHPASLHLVDLVSRLGDDWYLIPQPARAGTIARVTSAVLTDAAGGRWRLGTDPGWSFFAVDGADPDPAAPQFADGEKDWHRGLPVLMTASTALEGGPVEEVALAVDEDENLLWAAVLRADGVRTESAPASADAGPAHAQPRGLGEEEMVVRWSLGGAPPAHRVPYLYGALVREPGFGAAQDEFVQARMVDPRTGELTQPPTSALLAPAPGAPAHTLRPLAVPASGLRLVRRAVLARDTHGRPLRWMRHERMPLDVAVDVDMPWDVVTPAGG